MGRSASVREEPVLLLLEAALDPPGAAVIRGGKVLSAATTAPSSGSGRRGDLVGTARDLLARHRIDIEDLRGVVVGTGPGSFTGLRVALGLARGLGAVPGVRLVGIDSPRTLAAMAGESLPVWAAIPWGRRRLFLAQATVAGPVAEPNGLMPREALSSRKELAGARLVVPEERQEMKPPAGCELRVAKGAPVEAMASIVLAAGSDWEQLGEARPAYVVPPDAVLPVRPTLCGNRGRIEKIGPEQVEAVTEIERRCFTAPWSRTAIEHALKQPVDQPVLLAIDDSGPVGVGRGGLVSDEFEILSIAVLPERRGRGHARRLVRALLEHARCGGARRAWLEVRADNRAAIGLYASEGFVPAGRRSRYYRDGTDAVVMSLALARGENELER